MGSVEPVFLTDLMVVNLHDLFILRADVFKARIELIKGKLISFKQLGDHFFKGFGFRAWMDDSCINERVNKISNTEAEIRSRLHKIDILPCAKGVIDVFYREITQMFFRRFVRDLSCLFALFIFNAFLI